MTKEQFKKHLQTLVDYKKEEDRIYNLMRKSILKDDFSSILFGIGHYEGLIVGILKDACNDKYDYIEYWLYELNMGKEWKANSVRDDNNKSIKLKTISDLANYIYK